MGLVETVQTLARRADLAQFLRFCVVGAAGFLVDAAVLMAAIHVVRLDPVSGRLLSFAVALVATFLLNRHWAFQSARGHDLWTAFSRYVGVQGVGFLCNFGVYTLLYLTLPKPWGAPLLCLVVASAVALLVNYLGVRMIVFRPAKDQAD